MDIKKIFANSLEIAPNSKVSIYPEPFYSMMINREKRRLGDYFGLSKFGVNLTRLAPSGISALFHAHSHEEEFIYILEGEATLKTDDGEFLLASGMCAGFKAGGNAHQLLNKSNEDVVYLEIGNRDPNDSATYPNDDIAAHKDEGGKWVFTHKDGTEY
jgi:uncharacterized cupin superfamily protein